MKAFFRILVIGTGLTLIVMAIGVLLLGTQAGSAADIALERSLEYAYETEVTVDRVVFLPGLRGLTIEGLTVNNPSPFEKGPAIHVGEIEVRLQPASLLSTNPEVDEIVLRDATFFIRYEVGQGTNLGKLDTNAREHRAEDSESKPVLASRTYAVKQFRSEQATLDVRANVLPGAGLKLTLAPFAMKNIRSDKPMSTAQLCSILIQSVLSESLSLRGLLQPVADRLNDELQRLRELDEAPTVTPEAAE